MGLVNPREDPELREALEKYAKKIGLLDVDIPDFIEMMMKNTEETIRLICL